MRCAALVSWPVVRNSGPSVSPMNLKKRSAALACSTNSAGNFGRDRRHAARNEERGDDCYRVTLPVRGRSERIPMFDPASIGAALGSAKAILELLRNANDAQLAMKISSEVANVQGRLIDVQQQALTLQNENQDLRDEIRRLKAKLAETVDAEPCPSCRRKGWHVESTQPDPVFGDLGSSRRLYRCSFCGFSESKLAN